MTKMEETYFEDPNPAHVLLLVLVKYGLATPYDMLSQAGMGVGQTSPGLKRLEQARLLTGTSHARGSIRYAITEKGEDELRAQLESGRMRYWWLEESNVYRSIPRTLLLAWLYAGSQQVSDCMDAAVRELQTLARIKKQEAQQLREAMLRSQAKCRRDGLADQQGSVVAAVYQWLKAESDAALLAVQVEAMKTMEPLLATLPTPPKQ